MYRIDGHLVTKPGGQEELLNMLIYADDMADVLAVTVLADTLEDLDELVQALDNTAHDLTLTISIPQSTTMAMDRNGFNQPVRISIRVQEVEQVNSYL